MVSLFVPPEKGPVLPLQPESPYKATSPGDGLTGSDLSHEVEFLLAKASGVCSERANLLLRDYNLKVRSYSVLSLACSNSSPSQRELAEFLRLDPSQIVALVDDLERRGAVARQPDPQDRRSNVIVATDEGRRIFDQAAAATREARRMSLAALSDTEVDALRTMLRKIALP
jgi:DNA-binding MarR family transcriptional regulator